MKKLPPIQTQAERLSAAARVREESLLDELAILKLSHFTRRLWPVIEPGTPLVDNWHIDAVCDEVQAQLEGRDGRRDVLLSIPPGFLKSIIVSVMRPAWCWLHWPHRRSIYVSNTDDLSSRDSRRTRDVLKSDVYGRLMLILAHPSRKDWVCPCCGQSQHPKWTFAPDQDEKDNFANSLGGFRVCIPMGSRGKTGHRGDDIVFDDPLDADVLSKSSPEMRRQLLKDADQTIGYVETTRVNNPKTATRTVVMQRLHLVDPIGVRIGEGGWRVVSLPQHFDPARACEADRRKVEGELLCPEMWDEAALARPRAKLGLAQFMAQHEQSPLREEGGLFTTAMVSRRYTEPPEQVAARCDEVSISVDCTFKGSDTSDRVAIQCWGREGGSRFYLLDRVCERMGFLATVEAIRSMKRRWPQSRVTLVEATANGPAVMEVLSAEFPGVVPFNPRGSSKYERAKVGALPAFEAGNVYLPATDRCPWVDGYIAEMLAFGDDCEHDDEVDATSQLLLRWTSLATGDAAVELPLSLSVPLVVDTQAMRRWSEPRVGREYVVGCGVEWTTGPGSASVAVVFEVESGAQVATVRVEGGGVEAFAEAVAEEASWWNMARVVVASERPELAHRVGVIVSRAGPRVVCRPGHSVFDGSAGSWGRRDWVELWQRLGSAARAGLVECRDATIHAVAGGVRAGSDGIPRGEASRAVPVEAIALMAVVALRGGPGQEQRPGGKGARQWRAVRGPGSGGDAWSRTAVASGMRAR